ncbi:hypothetical protein NXH76_02865 [Blautia schinkii]|nr:hypothetical protein [Blautia schinkii]
MDIHKLEEIGINPGDALEQMGEEAYLSQLKSFIGGYEFMRLGQAVSRGQWQTAMMILRRMEQKMNGLGLENMKRQMPQLRKSIMSKNRAQARNALALLVQKRVQLLKLF